MALRPRDVNQVRAAEELPAAKADHRPLREMVVICLALRPRDVNQVRAAEELPAAKADHRPWHEMVVSCLVVSFSAVNHVSAVRTFMKEFSSDSATRSLENVAIWRRSNDHPAFTNDDLIISKRRFIAIADASSSSIVLAVVNSVLKHGNLKSSSRLMY